MKIPSLILLVLLWPILAWSQAPIYRQFFTTNVNPIVDVVAGSNATVVATTPASNIRRFTVSSTATGGGQTNITVVKPDDGSVVISTNIAAGISTYGVGLSTVLTNKMYGSNVIGVVPEANNSVNATNLFNANLPIPTNTPAAGKVITATSAVSSGWATASGGVTVPAEMIASYGTLFGSNNFWEAAKGVIIKDNFRGVVINPAMAFASVSGGGAANTASLIGGLQHSLVRLSCRPTNTASYGTLRTSGSGNAVIISNFAFSCMAYVGGYELSEHSVGLINTPATLTTTDSIRWIANTNWSSNWIGVCTANSSSTYITSSVPVAINELIKLSIYAPSTNVVHFYANDNFVGTIPSTIPAVGRVVGVAMRSFATANTGSDTAQTMDLSWYWWMWN